MHILLRGRWSAGPGSAGALLSILPQPHLHMTPFKAAGVWLSNHAYHWYQQFNCTAQRLKSADLKRIHRWQRALSLPVVVISFITYTIRCCKSTATVPALCPHVNIEANNVLVPCIYIVMLIGVTWCKDRKVKTKLCPHMWTWLIITDMIDVSYMIGVQSSNNDYEHLWKMTELIYKAAEDRHRLWMLLCPGF